MSQPLSVEAYFGWVVGNDPVWWQDSLSGLQTDETGVFLILNLWFYYQRPKRLPRNIW